MDIEIEKHWLEELESFISHWEQETEMIREKALPPDECVKISDVFKRDSDGLLVRRPVGVTDHTVMSRLEALDNKLTTTLAMACSVKTQE